VVWRRDDPSPALKAFMQIIRQLSQDSHRLGLIHKVRR